MTLFEALQISGHTLAALSALGYGAGDERYLPLFRDYLGMSANGDKKTYVVAILATKYGVSERTVYSVVKRFSADCNDGAAE